MSDYEIILASSSSYRASLLKRFQLPFKSVSPDTDESPKDGETPEQLVIRLSEAKARAVAQNHQQATVIGSDQVCAFAGQICGKPLTTANAVQQLQSYSDKCMKFFTGLCVLTADGQVMSHVDITTVEFRLLRMDEIERYVAADNPLDCAGSFKMESLGLSLFRSVRTTDPSALIGLPLIKLAAFLRQAGYAIP